MKEEKKLTKNSIYCAIQWRKIYIFENYCFYTWNFASIFIGSSVIPVCCCMRWVIICFGTTIDFGINFNFNSFMYVFMLIFFPLSFHIYRLGFLETCSLACLLRVTKHDAKFSVWLYCISMCIDIIDAMHDKIEKKTRVCIKL